MVKYLIIYIKDIIFLDSTELNAPHIFENDDIDIVNQINRKMTI